MLCVQNSCYEDSRINKIFYKFIILLYRMDVLPEAAILYWYQKGANSKGKGNPSNFPSFLPCMLAFPCFCACVCTLFV